MRQLARAVQALEDSLGAEMAEVEQDVPVQRRALVDLGLLGARDDVARGELHRVGRIPHEEALAVLVQEVRPSPRQPSVMSTPVGASVVGWNCIISMSFSATPDSERKRHAVARCRRTHSSSPCTDARAPVARITVFARIDVQPAVQKIPGDHALAATVVDRRASTRRTPRTSGCRAS